MKPWLSRILVCPGCHSRMNLAIFGEDRGDIISGDLSCSTCGREYPIVAGIPYLHPDPTISDSSVGTFQSIPNPEKQIEAANVAYHNNMASAYESDLSTNYIFEENCQKRICEILEKSGRETEGKYALDIGCGTGNILKYTSKIFETAVGIDLSPEMLQISKKYSPHVIFGTGLHTPFPDGVFDLVSCFSLLHHILEPTDLLREGARILKTGGFFYSDWDFNRFFFWKPLFPLWMHRFNAPRALLSLTRRKLIRSPLVRAFETAEYHVFADWIDPVRLQKCLENLGFSRVEILYHWNSSSINPKSRPKDKAVELLKTILSLSFNPRYQNPIFAVIARK